MTIEAENITTENRSQYHQNSLSKFDIISMKETYVENPSDVLILTIV